MTLSSSTRLKRHFRQQKYVLFKSGRNHLKTSIAIIISIVSRETRCRLPASQHVQLLRLLAAAVILHRRQRN